MQRTEFREASILNEDAQTLLELFDAELNVENSVIHTIDLGTFANAGGVFWIAYQSGQPIACGAIRPINDSDAELKRMFVLASVRRQGIGRELLSVIEERSIAQSRRMPRLAQVSARCRTCSETMVISR